MNDLLITWYLTKNARFGDTVPECSDEQKPSEASFAKTQGTDQAEALVCLDTKFNMIPTVIGFR